jgi:hypothetical protein
VTTTGGTPEPATTLPTTAEVTTTTTTPVTTTTPETTATPPTTTAPVTATTQNTSITSVTTRREPLEGEIDFRFVRYGIMSLLPERWNGTNHAYFVKSLEEMDATITQFDGEFVVTDPIRIDDCFFEDYVLFVIYNRQFSGGSLLIIDSLVKEENDLSVNATTLIAPIGNAQITHYRIVLAVNRSDSEEIERIVFPAFGSMRGTFREFDNWFENWVFSRK